MPNQVMEVVKKAVIPQQPVNLKVRKAISKVADVIRKMPDHLEGDCYPLKHSFADGLYVRELTVPPKILTVTKIHKYSHAGFLLKGEMSILEEGGIKHIKAPCYFITPAGTKRIIYHHDEVVLVTVHATKKTDLKEIEDEIIAKDFDNLLTIDVDFEEENKLIKFVTEVTKLKENT